MKAEINEPTKTKPTIPKRVSLSTSHNSAKGTAGSKSAGNTPSSSPLVSKDVLTSKNVQKRRNLKEELNIDDEEVINVDGLDEVTASEGGLSTPKGQCPCFNTGSKNALLIKCVKCTQAFHPTCVNLNGLTKASMNKLTTWKCPDCFIFPYSQQSEKRSEAEAFSDFLKIFPRISQCNEELKESASTVEFFNEHIKHLVINEDSYKVQSQKLNHMETEIKLIKQGMDRLSKLSQEKNELEIPKLEILKQMQVQLQDFIRSNDNKDSKELSECSAGAIKDALADINRFGLLLEKNSSSIRLEIDSLKEVIHQQVHAKEEDKKSNEISFDRIDSIIADINAQLHSISDHVCPKGSLGVAVNVDGDRSDMQFSPPLTPNTASPHLVSTLPTQGPACDPYIKYVEDVVTDDLREKLLQVLETSSADFTSVGGSRDVLYFGEHGYWYTGAYHKARTIPLEIQDLIDCVRPSLPNTRSWINSCLVTRYRGPNSHIPMHSDNEASIDPESDIITVSIGQERTLKFIHTASSAESSLTLKNGSVYVMSRLSQEIWKHGIDPLEGLNEDTEDLNNVDQDQLTDHDIERPADSLMNRDEVRYSFTFRHVAPFFKNSTVIVGDSNTKYIKFGKDAGTLGKWLPGKRMWAAKIGDIPSPKDIGPYRNIVIHSGINDIRDDFNRASNRALIGQLKRKCDDIQKFYPNAKLHLSLLLPTKSPHVNVRVRELNSLFIDFVFNRNNMFVIDNSVLGTQNGCMPSKYGRFLRNGTPLANDVVHLGREGLRLFCMNIKRCIVQRGERQSVERFRGRSGDYRDALIRGGRSPIFHRS
ncbi:hypothetical protein ACHWQZ_G000024 [Mnemiopsis leidyi]